jgi:hypothetical protein
MATPSGQWYFEGPKGDRRDNMGSKGSNELYPPLADTSEDVEWNKDIEDNGLDTGSFDCRKFRVQPDNNVLVPFLTAFANAAVNMPVLKEACVWTLFLWGTSDLDGYEDFDSNQISKWPERPLAWGITYIAPYTFGFHPHPGQHFSQSRQLWWTTAQWRPSDELRYLFQQTGNKVIRLIEYWGHEKYEQKLALRPLFDHVQIFGYRHPDSPWSFQQL